MNFTKQEIKKLAAKYFGLNIEKVKKLDGYESFNFLLEDEKAYKFVLKLYPETADHSLIDAETAFLKHLSSEMSNSIPESIPSKNGNFLEQTIVNSESFTIRLLNFLEGKFLAESEQKPKLIYNFGKFMGKLQNAGEGFERLEYRARNFNWDLFHNLENKTFLAEIIDPGNRKIAEYFFQKFEYEILPIWPKLRKGIIHNDPNDWNVLVDDKDQIKGIIDFGDACHTAIICDVAIACAYLIFGKNEPLESVVDFVKGFHSEKRLEELELDVLFNLIANRLCATVCNSAHSKKLNPENEYISISEKPAWEALKKWISINPIQAVNRFKKACGLQVNTIESNELIKKRQAFFSPALSMSYKTPIHLKSSAFQYFFDAKGHTYLDAYNNIPLVGHAHPKIVEAGRRQMANLNTNTRYLYDSLFSYSEKLLAKFPPSLNKIFFVNSGSAASDLAVRIASNFTKRKKLAVMEHGYHGNTQIGIDISSYKFDGNGGQGKATNIIRLDMPDLYRSELTGKDFADAAISKLSKEKKEIAAFFMESIMGCGGQVPIPADYAQSLFKYIRSIGGICVCDEVQIGFGRVGTHFWAFEQLDLLPDMVILGKPMGNGHPMAAVVCTEKLADSFANGMEFFSSFGGNPVSCAIGEAVLDVLEEEKLQKNALEIGLYFMQEMEKLKRQHDQIGDIRGTGLFLGFEMVENQITREPATRLANHIKNKMKEAFVLVGTDGPFNNVIKSKPPLCFNVQNVDHFIKVFGEILRGLKAQKV